jgi:hypothetical protein
VGVTLVGVSIGVQVRSCREDGELAEIEPALWLERQLPLLEDIDIGDRLKKDRWMVIFYKDGCPACEERIPDLLRMPADVDRIALIEVPSSREGGQIVSPRQRNRNSIIYGRLKNGKTWVIETPLVVNLRDSIVVEVSH